MNKQYMRGFFMGKDRAYDVVYRGETREYLPVGKWVFFQRLKEYGGGYWLGRVGENCFILEVERPVSLREGIDFLLRMNQVESDFLTFDDDFQLTE